MCYPQAIAGYQIKKLIPFNPVDKKTTAEVVTPDGQDLIVTKGAPQVSSLRTTVRTHRMCADIRALLTSVSTPWPGSLMIMFRPSACMPQIIGDMLADKMEQQTVETYISERASRGLRSLGVAQSADGGATWQLVGLISLLDPPRPDSAATIQRAQELGVEVRKLEVRFLTHLNTQCIIGATGFCCHPIAPPPSSACRSWV